MEIESISVKMTFEVGLGGFEMSQEAFDQIKELNENGLDISSDNLDSEKHQEAWDWLNKNIKSIDAYEWEYEIHEIK